MTDPRAGGCRYAALVDPAAVAAEVLRLAGVLRSDVLDDPALDGLVYTVEDAFAGGGAWSPRQRPCPDGVRVYRGFVLSGASLAS